MISALTRPAGGLSARAGRPGTVHVLGKGRIAAAMLQTARGAARRARGDFAYSAASLSRAGFTSICSRAGLPPRRQKFPAQAACAAFPVGCPGFLPAATQTFHQKCKTQHKRSGNCGPVPVSSKHGAAIKPVAQSAAAARRFSHRPARPSAACAPGMGRTAKAIKQTARPSGGPWQPETAMPRIRR